jgi:N-acetylneuraminic acid mutarotase
LLIHSGSVSLHTEAHMRRLFSAGFLCAVLFLAVVIASGCAGGGGGDGGGGSTQTGASGSDGGSTGGGPGGTGGGSTPGGVPSIGALQLIPDQAIQGSGGNEATVEAAFHFSDDGGDLADCTVSVYDASGSGLTDSTITLQDLSGVKSGSAGVTFRVSTTSAGTFTVQLKVTDRAGLTSNTLAAAFGIASPPSAGPAWKTGSPMPTARGGLAAAVIDGKLYAVGGADDHGNIFNVVECYDPATGRWTTKSPMPTPRTQFAVAVVNGKLYAIGGSGGDGTVGVEQYDPQTDTWAARSRMPTGSEYDFGAGVINGRIYLVGGFPMRGQMYYDPAADAWTILPSPVIAHMGWSGAVLGEKLYLAGGFLGDEVDGNLLEYDPGTNSGASRSGMPTPRAYLTSAVPDGKLYAIGGHSGESPYTNTLHNEVERYDPATDTWTKKTPMPTPRNLLASGVIDGKVYVVGGFEKYYTGSQSNRLEIYDPAADR